MILGIYGYQDSGKTTLAEKLVHALVEKGYRVSTVKHSAHGMSVDAEGKDTWRHWKAGSDPVVFSSDAETTIIRHSKTPIEDIARMLKVDYRPDVILVEGLKQGKFKKVALGNVKPTADTVLRNPNLEQLLRYVENEVAVERIKERIPGLNCRKCGKNCDEFARAVVAGKRKLGDCVEMPDVIAEISIGGSKLSMGRFASKVVNETVRGLVGSLHGYEPDKDVDIHLGPARPVQIGKRIRR